MKKINNIQKIFNLGNVTTTNDDKNWSYRMLLIGPSGSGKTNTLLNLIHQDNNIIDKIYLYAKDLEEPKYQFLIKKREDARIKNLGDKTAFIGYFNSMDDIYGVSSYNPKRKGKVLIVFDYMIDHVMSNKKAQLVLKKLFIRCRKLNISLLFNTQSYSSVTKEVRLN